MIKGQEPGFFRRNPWKLLAAGAVLSASALSLYEGFEASPEQAALEEFTSRGHVAASVSRPNEPNEPNAPKPEAAGPKTLRVYRGFEDPNYAIWDAQIIDYTSLWNREYSDHNGLPGWEPLDPEYFKTLCLYECRNGNVRAFRRNPAQFGNRGDPAFIVMRDGKEFGIPKGGYEDLHGYNPISPRFKELKTKQGKIKRVFDGWDFEEEGIIPPELCLKYGIGWLWHKNCIFDNVLTEEGPVRAYTIRSRDNLSGVAKRLGTTVQTIQKYSGIQDPDSIRAGQEISYRSARIGPEIVGFRGWLVPAGAVDMYNGIGKKDKDTNYLEGVREIYNKPKD